MNIKPDSEFVSIEEYLDGEQNSESKHEYINGIVHAMGGASVAHNLISLNLSAALRKSARINSCQIFMADVKVHLNIGGDDIFYYPDVLVSCDQDDRDLYYRSNPCLVVEVLSPSTERIDRREKFLAYTSLDSLQEYILVAQDRQVVTVFRRKNEWKPELFVQEGTFVLDCLNCTVTVAQIYEDVDVCYQGNQ